MKNLKQSLPVAFLLLFVAVLIVVVIGVSRRSNVAPNAPSSKPLAASCLLTFNIAPLVCDSNCVTGTANSCGAGLTCYSTSNTPGGPGVCRNPACLTTAGCACATPIPGQPACQSKVAYRDVSTNTAGHYATGSANLIQTTDVVKPGDKIVFLLTGAAVTASTSGNVVWSDMLDPQFTYLDGASCITYDAATNTVTCNQGIVGTSSNYNVAFRVQLKNTATGASILNTALIKVGTVPAGNCSISLTLPSTTPTPSPSPTPTPVPGCNSTCATNADCPSNMTCVPAGYCRNPSAPDNTDCSVPTTGGFYIRKFNDHNGNGTQDIGDEGLDWKFQFDENGDNNWRDYQTFANKNGEGGVVTLPVGTQVRIKEVPETGWSATNPTNPNLTIQANNNQLMVFGNWQGPTATPAPALGCSSACATNSDCPSSMNCVAGACRNPSCSDSTNCVCATTATPVPSTLPKTGAIDDTLILIGAGVGAVVLGLVGLLAL